MVRIDAVAVLGHAEPLQVATLESASGMRLRVLDIGATAWSLEVPDAAGRRTDVLLGYATPAGYLDDPYYLGALVGRFANRIAGAAFPLDGRSVHLTANAGRHHLHGGARGFSRVRWRLTAITHAGHPGVALEHVSPAGDEGYPGTLAVRVTYVLTDDAWIVEATAETDRPTPVSLVQHAYFNLAGHGSVRDHALSVRAARYLPVDAEGIPNGPVATADGTPFDLRVARRIGDVLDALAPARGIDHTFELARDGVAAVLHDPASGRTLEVTTSAPGLHVYTANFLRDVPGKAGARHGPHDGICLEAQQYPDAPNRPDFPDCLVRPGVPYAMRTVFRFPRLSAPRRAG